MEKKTDTQFILGAGAPAPFDDTDWWVIREAGRLESLEVETARANLCRTYWRPIYRYIRKLGYSHEDAQDQTQAFLARCLEKNYVLAACREKGRFRTFLLTLLKRFLADQWDRAHCQKRGGDTTPMSLNDADTAFLRRGLPADGLTPDKLIDRAWAESLLTVVLTRLAQESANGGWETRFQAVRPFVIGEREVAYAEAARKLGLAAGNLKVLVHRLRRRYRKLLRDEIARTARSPAEVEEAIRDLCAVLREFSR